MQSAQDPIFVAETWDPAQQWFDENGFTLPLSMLVIVDSLLQSGSMLWFLRQRFREVPPAKGGREKCSSRITRTIDICGSLEQIPFS